MCHNPKLLKITTNPYFGGLRSFKVIDVDIPKKLVKLVLVIISMDVCAYLQLFSC